MLRSYFSYRPRSGSRVLVSRPVAGVCIAHPGPGTICAGWVTVLSYYAAQPGAYWRHEAKEAARQIVAAVGGMAEDDQGTITLVVRRDFAARAAAIMEQVARANAKHNSDDNYDQARRWNEQCSKIDVALWQDGLATITLADRLLTFARNYDGAECPWTDRHDDGRWDHGWRIPARPGLEQVTWTVGPVSRPDLKAEFPGQFAGDPNRLQAVRFGLEDAFGKWVDGWYIDLSCKGHRIPVDVDACERCHVDAIDSPRDKPLTWTQLLRVNESGEGGFPLECEGGPKFENICAMAD